MVIIWQNILRNMVKYGKKYGKQQKVRNMVIIWQNISKNMVRYGKNTVGTKKHGEIWQKILNVGILKKVSYFCIIRHIFRTFSWLIYCQKILELMVIYELLTLSVYFRPG